MAEDHKCTYEKKIILMEDHVKDIGRDTKKNNDAIHGNGKPGLLTITALNSQSIRTLTRFQWLNIGAIIGAATKIVFFGG